MRYYDVLRQSLAGLRTPESVEYIYWNVTGSGQGWFHPGQSRYGWAWLAARYDAKDKGRITRQEFRGPADWFDRLDRNRDGVLTASDFDWTDPAPEEMRAMMSGQLPRPKQGQAGRGGDMRSRLPEMMANQLFSGISTKDNGRISRDDWLAFFNKAARGKDYLTREDLRAALPLALPRRTDGQPAQARGLIALIRIIGMFKAETGSILEGPSLGQLAPDFKLKTPDGKQAIALSSFRGKKPVVLVFGNFT
jgi:hypothetical protein